MSYAETKRFKKSWEESTSDSERIEILFQLMLVLLDKTQTLIYYRR